MRFKAKILSRFHKLEKCEVVEDNFEDVGKIINRSITQMFNIDDTIKLFDTFELNEDELECARIRIMQLCDEREVWEENLYLGLHKYKKLVGDLRSIDSTRFEKLVRNRELGRSIRHIEEILDLVVVKNYWFMFFFKI